MDNSNGNDTTMCLAPSCSTCKWALFKQRGRDYYYGRGKKQMGMCLVLCDGDVPDVLRAPYPDVKFEVEYIVRTRTYRDTVTGLSDAARRNRLVEQEEYIRMGRGQYLIWLKEIQARLDHTAAGAGARWDSEDSRRQKCLEEERAFYSWIQSSSREEHVRKERAQAEEHREAMASGETLKKYVSELEAFYPIWRVNYDWWQKNWPKCRRCHRVCSCDAYEFVGGWRENVARSIAKGNGINAYALNNGSKKE